MRRTIAAAVVVLGLGAVAAPALAHVTVQPNEAVIGEFSRSVVRVPNERDDAGTTKVKVELPPLAFVSFEPKDGWKRTVEMVEFDEPIEVFGEEITEGVGSVTWSGGKIGAGEFDEFGFSARMPDGETTLTFNAIQTYSSGEVVEWTGAPDSEEPAAQVEVYDIGAGEGEGQLAVLARLNEAAGEAAGGPATEGDEEDDKEESSGSLGVLLGGLGVALGFIAILFSAPRRVK